MMNDEDILCMVLTLTFDNTLSLGNIDDWVRYIERVRKYDATTQTWTSIHTHLCTGSRFMQLLDIVRNVLHRDF